MNEDKMLNELLRKFKQLDTMEQTPQVILLKAKLPKMIEKYQQVNKIEEAINILLQYSKELLEQTKEGIEEMNRELLVLIPEEQQ